MTTSNRTNSTGNARRSAGTPRTRRGRMGVNIQEGEVNYKDAAQMRRIINDRGKIDGTRRTGASAKLQRRLAEAVKRARHLALIPMAPHHKRLTESLQEPSQRTQVVSTPSAPPESQEGEGAPESTEPSTQEASASATESEGESKPEAPADASDEQNQETPDKPAG